LLNGDAPLLMQAIGSSAIGPLAKIAVSFPLIYHYLGGVRHIVWDKQPETHINNESVEKSSYILFGAAGALSLITAVL
jgi:succinate dehydrogenase (ubiquinone) cytochrome b560 subunit